MTLEEIRNQAEELANKYNPEWMVPFPFENILNDHKDMSIFFVDFPPEYGENISWMIRYKQSSQEYHILINTKKAENRKYFTIAHEIWHYFLHKPILAKTAHWILIDEVKFLDWDVTLFRDDDVHNRKIESEANNFAASLIMPKRYVETIWDSNHSIEECAQIFWVSAVAMTIRLTALWLIQ